MSSSPPQGENVGLYKADVIESDTTYSGHARLLWCWRTDDDIDVTLASEIEIDGRIIDIEAATTSPDSVQMISESGASFVTRGGFEQSSLFVNPQTRQRIVFFDGDWLVNTAAG